MLLSRPILVINHMKKLNVSALICTILVGPTMQAFGQSRNSGDPAAGCAAVGVMMVVWVVMMLVIFGVAIGVIVFIVKWIGKDATLRGMPNAQSIKWLGLLGLLGLVIYLLQRPQGNAFPCPHCGKPRMQGLPQCPSCYQP